jgi:hypothetical protein
MPASGTRRFLPLLNYAQIRTEAGTFTERAMRSLYYGIQDGRRRMQRTRNVLETAVKVGPVRDQQFLAPSQSVADDGVLQLPKYVGGLLVVRSTNDVGIFLLDTGTVTSLHDPNSAFSVAASTSSKVNVYWSSGNNRFELENKSGGSREISVTYLGAA